MLVLRRPLSRLLLLVLLLLGSRGARAQRRFEVWYPQYQNNFLGTIRDNCSQPWDRYVTNDANYCHEHFCLVLELMDCLLANSHETIKSNMANAGILLGSLPTTLGFLGTSTVEMGLLAGRRPLLALLLAAGSPSVSPLRTIAYRGPFEILQHGLHASTVGLGRTQPSVLAWSLSWAAVAAVTTMQYLLATAAVGNLGHVCYQLSVQVVYGFSPAMRVHPALWLLLGLAVHGGGTYAVWLRVRLAEGADRDDLDGDNPNNSNDLLDNYNNNNNHPPISWLPANNFRHIDEFCLSALQRRVTLRARPERLWFVFVSWATATGTVMHIIYGTLVFSSALFIGTRDAFVVVARFFFSMVACRIILMFELSGMRDSIRVIGDEDEAEAAWQSRQVQAFPLLPQQHLVGPPRARETNWTA